MIPENDWKKIPYSKGEGKVVYCIGAGPSLRGIDLEPLKKKQEKNGDVVIAVNKVAERLNWADLVTTSDTSILKNHYDLPFFLGLKIACMYKDFGESDAFQPLTRNLKQRSDVIYIERIDKIGLSLWRDKIHGNANSGFGALNLAFHMNPKKIVLLGYDFTHHQSYWYDGSELKGKEFPHHKRQYNQFLNASCQLDTMKVKVINGSLISKLPFWIQCEPSLLINEDLI